MKALDIDPQDKAKRTAVGQTIVRLAAAKEANEDCDAASLRDRKIKALNVSREK
jgi:hypothetical protein